jgi:DNA-directed RNA polymerase subunit beta
MTLHNSVNVIDPLQVHKREIKNFSKIPEDLLYDIPFLIEVQKRSFDWFLESGLRDLFVRTFPIKGYSDNLELQFVDYFIDEPNTDISTCKDRDLTYSASLRLRLKLINRISGVELESDVFLGDLPMMTDNGTFVINGAERAVVSQLVRSPGVYFMDKITTAGKQVYYARVIPNRGAWIEIEHDPDGACIVRLDKVRKIPVTNLMMGLDFVVDPDRKTISHRDIQLILEAKPFLLQGLEVPVDLYAPTGGRAIAKKGDIINEEQAIKLSAAYPDGLPLPYPVNSLKMDDSLLKTYEQALPTLEQYVQANPKLSLNDAALLDIYKKLRPGDPPTIETARSLLESRFFDERRYDLSPVGRFKMNKKLGINIPDPVRYLTKIDIIESLRYLLDMTNDQIDDIDHLGNRRIRSVGELIQNHFRKGLLRMERVAKERMAVQDHDKLTPQLLINTRSVVAVLKEFFGSSQLSQFMDQTNPLAELTHKRRLSALGPGGLSRERTGFEVRDVHHSHYGRICPIESPEGPNIGLIGSLATYAIINNYGFIETPYRVVRRGKVIDEVQYLSADEEDRFTIAEANAPLDKNGRLIDDLVHCRAKDKISMRPKEEIQFMDVSPMQIVSPTTALIPFLEHDDANRALMGSNMQRQAVPLMMPEAPLVGTGMERKVAYDSGAILKSEHAGKVIEVQADKIVIERRSGEIDVYNLMKFVRSNQGTCMNQRPIVHLNQKIKAGDVIADGFSTRDGELALGKNILCAFMPWRGYNFEDAIILSQRLVQDDTYTSIHIEKYECEARDTKLGPEEITRDIPHLSENMLRNLDDNGVVVEATEVQSEDILVGKVTPKGETEPTPEEKLLRAIFGEKSLDVRNTSLKVPHGDRGKVIKTKIFSREAGDELSPGVNKLVRVYIAQRRKIQEGDKMAGRHGNKGVISKIVPVEDMPFMENGVPIDIVLNPLGVPSRMNLGQILETHLGWAADKLGWRAITPVFSGATEHEITQALEDAGLPISGKTTLYDGKSGEQFDNIVTVGQIYMMKLNHLVEDKIHARSVGSYALVTQQPLGGKAQFGGQRFGEMEVWALEAYGAAHVLQEILTIKSDDVEGRNRTYEAIVKGELIEEPGVPESFNVLVKELQGLCLDVRFDEIIEGNGEAGPASVKADSGDGKAR